MKKMIKNKIKARLIKLTYIFIVFFLISSSYPVDKAHGADFNPSSESYQSVPESLTNTISDYQATSFDAANYTSVSSDDSDYMTTNAQTGNPCPSTMTDIDGNIYNTVMIGGQCWMRENLMTTRYADGAAITRGPTGATWNGNDNGYYAYPPNSSNSAEASLSSIIADKLGFSYQWSAAMHGSTTEGAQGICPNDWHLPTDTEYKTLEKQLGMSQAQADATGSRGTDQGMQMKTISPSTFSAFLVGNRALSGAVDNYNAITALWSSTQYSTTAAWTRYLDSSYATVYRFNTLGKAFGFSVRCIKNSAIPTSTYASQLYTFDTTGYDNLSKLEISLLAYGTANAGNGITAKIWNNNSSTWESLNSLTNTSSSMPGTLAVQEITSNISSYVDANEKIRILIHTTNPSVSGTDAVLSTDYLKVGVWGSPSVSTALVSNITVNSASGNGNLTDIGGDNPTRSIEYGTTSGTYPNSCLAGVGSTGAYSCELIGLTPDTTYYYRAKATNSAGTSYGDEMMFTTLPDTVTISNPDEIKMSDVISSNYATLTSGTITATPEVTINTNLKIQDTIFNITFPTSTQITNTDTGNFNFQNFIAQNVSTTVKQELSTSVAAIKVGVPDTKLTFSQPATLSIDINPSYNGRTLDVFYQQDGETEWHSQTSCTVQDNKCIFTTTHATTYSVNGSGNMVGETGINLNTDIQEVIALNCGSATINLGNITPGSPVTASSTCAATTNANGGYSLSVKKDNATETLQKDSEPATTIPDKSPWDPTANANAGNADIWSGTGLGFTIYASSASKNTAWWGIGTTLTDSNNKYAGFSPSQTDIMIHSDYAETSTATSIGYKLDVPPTQKSGAYSGNITYQAVTTP